MRTSGPTSFYPFTKNRKRSPAWPFAINHDSPALAGLVGYWPLAGGFPYEIFRGRHGTTVTAVTWDYDDAVGAYGDFDGNTSAIAMDADTAFQITGDLSISFWIYPKNFSYSSDNTDSFIGHGANGETNDTNALYWLAAFEHDSNNIKINYGHESGAGVNTGVTSSAQYPKREWVHVCVIRDSVNKNIIHYRNGIQVTSDGYATNPDGGTSGALAIGDIWPSGGANGNVKLAHVAIYDRVLTGDIIYQLWAPETRWNLIAPLRDRVFVGLDVAIVPDTASLTLTTYAPTVLTPIIPFTRNLVITTYAPIVNISAPAPVITGSLLQIDWNDDGDFNDTGEDVTPRLISTQPLTCVRGKDQLRLLAPPMAGAFNCELDNRSRDYSVENSGSPIFANLHPGHKLRATLTASAVNYTIFTGILDDIPQHPEFGRWTVEMPALGSLSRLRGKRVSTPLLENVTTDQAMAAVLDAAGWPALERTLQVGLTTLDFYWTDNEDAFDAIAALLLTEGPGASVYEDAAGFFIFENRHSRITQVRSTTSQFTFTDQDYILPGYQYDSGIKDIINQVEVSVTTRTVKESDFVWQYSKPLILGPSETRVIRAVASDPFKDAITPDPDSGVNAVQLLSILGTAPQIRLSFRDEQTGDIGSTGGGPTASSIQTALESLSTISPGDVSVTLFASAPDVLKFDITWQGDYAHMPVELLGVSVVSLTGKAIEAKITDKTVGVVDDYDLLAGSVTSLTLNQTSGQSIEITIEAGGGGAYIDNLQMRAKLVSTDSSKRFLNTLDASDSIAKYGLHPYSPSIRTEISEEQAIQLADNIIRYYKDPRPMAVFPVAGTDGTIQLQQLTREISDCITIVDAQTGVNRTWFIERIAHRITEGPHIFTEFGCEAVVAGTVGGPGGGGGNVAIVGSAIVGTSTVGA